MNGVSEAPIDGVKLKQNQSAAASMNNMPIMTNGHVDGVHDEAEEQSDPSTAMQLLQKYQQKDGVRTYRVHALLETRLTPPCRFPSPI